MAWPLLILAALLEVVWAVALKHSHGFTRPWPSVLAVTTAAASFVLLSLAVRDLPVGTAYAAWVGIGALGVALAGIIAFHEGSSAPRLVFLLLIVAGVAGLKLTDT